MFKNLATKPNESMWFDWTPYMDQKGNVDTSLHLIRKDLKILDIKHLQLLKILFCKGTQVDKFFSERLKMQMEKFLLIGALQKIWHMQPCSMKDIQ